MNAQPEFLLLQDYENEIARWRRRTAFLLAVILQLFVLLLVLVSPRFFHFRPAPTQAQVVEKPKREVTMLTFPRDLLRSQKAPDTNILSDKNRIAQGKSPVINKNGLPMPYMRGNTRMPDIAGGKHPPTPPPTPQPSPKPQPQTAQAPKPAPPGPPAPKKEDQQEAQLRLEDVKPATGGNSPSVRLPDATAGQSIQQSIQAAIQNPSSGSGSYAGPGDSANQFQNIAPNFSTSGPIILSDTRGFNFGPYLARVVYIVRRNWYSVIPESARLGEKGRVALVFEIVRDGSVPQLRLLAGSGSSALDQAALASIKASNPFPPLPAAFTGNHLVLEFIYFYNMETSY